MNQIKGEFFDVYYANGYQDLAEICLNATPIIKNIARELDIAVGEFKDCYIVASEEDWLKYAGSKNLGRWNCGRLCSDKVILMGNFLKEDYNNEYIFKLIVHEYVHDIFDNFCCSTTAWLAEGVAVHLSGQPMGLPLEKGRPSIERLASSFGECPDRYGYSGAYVKFVYEQLGSSIFKEIYKNPQIVRELYGNDFEKLALEYYFKTKKYYEKTLE